MLQFLLLLVSPVLVAGQSSTSTFDETRFKQVVAKVQSSVVALARKVESLATHRCTDIVLNSCYLANYHSVLSTLPSTTCPAGINFQITACGDGFTCSGLWDFTTSTVSLPNDLANGDNLNPTKPQVIEAICMTRKLDEWIVQQRANDTDFWDSLDGDAEPQGWYFGSRHGAFRIFPGRSATGAESYDPRLRPWYVAASSGPKNVLLILDTGGSMHGVRLELLKQAAHRVISTLTVGDRVAIVGFGSDAYVTADQGKYLFVATEENKKYLLDQIDKLKARGQTNAYAAFVAAFNLLDATIAQEYQVDCNSAILFLTDGEITEPAALTPAARIAQVTTLVQDRLNTTQSLLSGHPILLFTYSVSEDANVETFPSQLACSVEHGVWSKIQTNEQIVDSLSSYYQLFALGLGSDANSDFVAWVEPYVYSTGDILGTTVSIPVYDRSVNPPLFIGVAGIDLPLSALNKALGTNSSEESIRRVTLVSTASCPALSLSTCALESYRRQGPAGDAALCTIGQCNASDFVPVQEAECPGVLNYPRDLWANFAVAGKSYYNRTCCKVGENQVSTECAAAATNPAKHRVRDIILFILYAVTALICVSPCCLCAPSLFVTCAHNLQRRISLWFAGRGSQPTRLDSEE
jgi:hypothetical protein